MPLCLCTRSLLYCNQCNVMYCFFLSSATLPNTQILRRLAIKETEGKQIVFKYRPHPLFRAPLNIYEVCLPLRLHGAYRRPPVTFPVRLNYYLNCGNQIESLNSDFVNFPLFKFCSWLPIRRNAIKEERGKRENGRA